MKCQTCGHTMYTMYASNTPVNCQYVCKFCNRQRRAECNIQPNDIVLRANEKLRASNDVYIHHVKELRAKNAALDVENRELKQQLLFAGQINAEKAELQTLRDERNMWIKLAEERLKTFESLERRVERLGMEMRR